MIRFLVLALVFLLSCAPGSTAVRSPAVVLNGGRCGGVILRQGVVLTAAHCAKSATIAVRPLAVVTWGSIRGRVYWRDTQADVALVSADIGAAVRPTRLPVVGERVEAVAPVYGWRVGDGMIKEAYPVGYYETDITIVPGWSGSPVFALSDGALVGVISWCRGTELASGEGVTKSCEPGFSVLASVPSAR